MSVVSFASEQIDFSLPNEPQIVEWLKGVSESEGCRLMELAYIFCSDEFLLETNLQYLSHNYYTDVITFDYSEDNHVSGDVFISVDRVRENAKILDVKEDQELQRVMVHGLLHLLGYNDKSPAQKSEMTLKEDFYLSSQAF
jgi:rRNA maturation RNase YbeY